MKPIGKEVAVEIDDHRISKDVLLYIDTSSEEAKVWAKEAARAFGTIEERQEDKRRFYLRLLRNYNPEEVKSYLESYPNI